MNTVHNIPIFSSPSSHYLSPEKLYLLFKKSFQKGCSNLIESNETLQEALERRKKALKQIRDTLENTSIFLPSSVYSAVRLSQNTLNTEIQQLETILRNIHLGISHARWRERPEWEDVLHDEDLSEYGELDDENLF